MKIQGGKKMNWMILSLVVGALLIIGIIAVNLMTTTNATEKITCQGCQGKCTDSKNCGISTCQAASGGVCNCGK